MPLQPQPIEWSIPEFQELVSILAAGYLRLLRSQDPKRRHVAQLAPSRISTPGQECPCYQVTAE